MNLRMLFLVNAYIALFCVSATAQCTLTLDSVLHTDAQCNGSRDGSITVYASGTTNTTTYTLDSIPVTIMPPQKFDNITLSYAGSFAINTPDTNWCAQSGGGAISRYPSGGCYNACVGYGSSTSNNWSSVIRTPAINCTGHTRVVVTFDLTSSYNQSHTFGSAQYSDALSFYLYAGGNYLDANSVKINGIERGERGTSNYMWLKLAPAFNCQQVVVTYNLTGITDLSQVMFFVLAQNPFNDNYPFSFKVDNVGVQSAPPGQRSNVFNNLSAGTYQVSVFDTNGCSATSAIAVGAPSPININLSKTDPTCFGACNGTTTVTATGSYPPYTYYWFNSQQTTQIQQNVCAGDEYVRVTDLRGCANESSITVTQPADNINTNFTVNDVSCNGTCDGSISLLSSIGTFDYSWPDGSHGTSFGSLCAGTYMVTISRPSSGCSKTRSFTVNEPSVLTAAITSSTNAGCGLATGISNYGSATVSASGGSGNYTYTWNTVPVQTTGTATNLGPGIYIVTVTAASNCSVTANVTIGTTSFNNIQVTHNPQHVSCYGQCNGADNVQVTGGVLSIGFTHHWNDGATASTRTNLCAGVYIDTVKDGGGCPVLLFDTILQPHPLAVTLHPTPVTTNGVCDGRDSAMVTGGTPPYTNHWNVGATTFTISNLCTGNYCDTVRDMQGCQVLSCNAVLSCIGFTSSITGHTDVRCNGLCTGAAKLTATGGNAGYTYLWNTTPPQTTDTVTRLCAGTYTVAVTDIGGCISTSSVTITEPSALSITFAQQHPTGVGVCDGIDTAYVTGGTGNPNSFFYLWSSGTAFNAPHYICLSLCAGNNCLTVNDANGCVATACNNMTVSVACTGTHIELTGIQPTCFGDNNGKLILQNVVGYFPYQFSLNGGAYQTLQQFDSVRAGTYIVDMIDAYGCTAMDTLNLIDHLFLSVSVINIDNATCGRNNGEIFTVKTGGGINETYVWNTIPPQFAGTAHNLAPGTYTVTLTDAQGCTASTSGTVSTTLEITTTVTHNDVTCPGGTDGSAKVTASGGIGNYNYHWNNAQTAATPTNLAAGTYIVTVDDSSFCPHSDTVMIASPPSFSAVVTDSLASSATNCDGFVHVIMSGGTAPYTYAWDNIPSNHTASIDSLCAGTYCLTVSDSNQCAYIICDTVPFVVKPGIVNMALENNVTVFPNPFSKTVTVTVDAIVTLPLQLELLDLFGRKLLEEKVNGNTVTVATSTLAQGVYFIRLNVDGIWLNKKIVKE